MKKWVVYVLGVVSGIALTIFILLSIYLVSDRALRGLTIFDEPGECMGYSNLNVMQVIKPWVALASADGSFGDVVLVVGDEGQNFYDNQEIVIGENQCAQRVGTYEYTTRLGLERTVPVVRVVDAEVSPKLNKSDESRDIDGLTMFEEPGDYVSRNDFEVQEVLSSGDAIAKEVIVNSSGVVITSDLEVLLLAQNRSNFYNNKVVKAPKGTRAMQVGTYKYHKRFDTKVIPVVEFR